MKKMLLFLCVMIGCVPFAMRTFAKPKGGNNARVIPPHSCLMCTNSVVRMNFYAYMKCKRPNERLPTYRHEYVQVGDVFSFENGLLLEIEASYYLCNGVTNIIPKQSMFNCLLTSTTNIPNRCIWDCE